MHVEQNVNDNVLKHLFGEKDILNIGRDMEEVGIRPWHGYNEGVLTL
jgi:hypothetical protein